MASAYPSVMTNSAWANHTWKGINDSTCINLENQPNGGGWILSNQHHLLSGSLQIVTVQVILLNTIYLGVYQVLKRFKQTKFVCSVLAGIILRNIMGNRGAMKILFPVEGEILMNTLGFIGMTLLVFLTAVKMDITMIRRIAKKASIVGVLSLLLPFACLLLLVFFSPNFDSKRPIFRALFAAGLAVTRFTNTAYAFDEMDLLTSKLGQLVMSSTMVNELFTWFVLIIGTSTRFCKVSGKYQSTQGFTIFGYILGLVSVIVFVIRPKLVLIVKKTPHGKPVKRIFILGILLLATIMTAMTDAIGAPHMGPLLLGLAVPDGPPLGSDLVRTSELFVMNYLMPLFYVIVGYNVNLSTLIDFDSKSYKDVKAFIISVALCAITKFIGGVLGALISKLSSKHAIIVGLMMNLKGPMDLFLFKRWSSRKEFDNGGYTILVISHLILTAIITPLIHRLYKNKMSANGTTNAMRELQTNPSIGEMRILCCVHHDQDIPIFLPLLKASNPTFNSPTSAYVAHLSNLDGRSVPVISHDDHRKIRRVHSNQLDHITFEFEKYAADSNGLVTTKMYTMIAPYKTMHHNIVSLARKKNIALIVTPFHKNYAGLEINEVGCVCTFNKNLLNISPCAVGVLVDNGMSQFTATCNVGVLFIGGADDREAATFATRMLGNPSVNMTLIRLKVSNYYRSNRNDAEERTQLKLDEQVMDDFRVKSQKNHTAVYRKIKVKSIEEAFDGIRALGSAQDLILVGRQRHVVKSIFDEAMFEWSEHRELGAVGDFVASADFQDGKTSVLVMQRCNVAKGGNHCSIHVSED